MANLRAPKRFGVWSRIPGVRRPGIAGLRDAIVWDTHQYREVDMRILRRCGLERGFEAQVVGITECLESNRLAGLLVRERMASNYQRMREIELDRILGLRDTMYDRLMLGSHQAIDMAIVRSMGEGAATSFGSSRHCWIDSMVRFTGRRDISSARVCRWLADIEEGTLLEDPHFTRNLRVA